VDLDEAVDDRRCLFKSCPRYLKGPGNGAFLMPEQRLDGETFAQLLPAPRMRVAGRGLNRREDVPNVDDEALDDEQDEP